MELSKKFNDCKSESDFMRHKYELEKKMFPDMDLSFIEWCEICYYKKKE